MVPSRRAPRSSQSQSVFLPTIRRIAAVSAGNSVGQVAASCSIFVGSAIGVVSAERTPEGTSLTILSVEYFPAPDAQGRKHQRHAKRLPACKLSVLHED